MGNRSTKSDKLVDQSISGLKKNIIIFNKQIACTFASLFNEQIAMIVKPIALLSICYRYIFARNLSNG